VLRRLHELAVAGAILILTVFSSWTQTSEEQRATAVAGNAVLRADGGLE
jgi:hypothetical protein